MIVSVMRLIPTHAIELLSLSLVSVKFHRECTEWSNIEHM